MIYFDNAATTFPKPEPVYSFMDEYYRVNGASAGRGQYRLASQANKLISDTRSLILDVLCAENKQVVFTATATEALNIIIQGINMENYANVYVSPFEHNAVMKNLYYQRKIKDIKIIPLSYDYKKYEYDLKSIEKQFNNNEPSYIIISHASNVTGQLAPVYEICKLGKKFGSLNIVDICQTAGLEKIDLSLNIYDYAVFAGHKTLYGPLGASGFVYKPDLKLEPILYGGNGKDSIELETNLETIEDIEVGSKNTLSISGLNAALKWLKKIGVNEIRRKDMEDREKLVSLLSKYKNIKLFGNNNKNDYIGVVSCKFNKFSSLEIGKILEKNNIAVRTGLHCSPYAHSNLDTLPDGTVRFSTGYFNTESDFLKLDKVLKTIYLNS